MSVDISPVRLILPTCPILQTKLKIETKLCQTTRDNHVNLLVYLCTYPRHNHILTCNICNQVAC